MLQRRGKKRWEGERERGGREGKGREGGAMMIAFRHRHRKLEVIKSSSLTVSFAPIRFPPPSAACSRSLRSFVRKRLHLIPDSVQFPSTPLLSSLSLSISLPLPLSLSANARFAGGYWNLWIWPLTQPTGGRLSTAVAHRHRPNGATRFRHKRGTSPKFGD